MNDAIKELEPQDKIYLELHRALVFSFKEAGFEHEDCLILAAIAIKPVHCALNLAQEAYKLHIEAVQQQPVTPIFLRDKL